MGSVSQGRVGDGVENVGPSGQSPALKFMLHVQSPRDSVTALQLHSYSTFLAG